MIACKESRAGGALAPSALLGVLSPGLACILALPYGSTCQGQHELQEPHIHNLPLSNPTHHYMKGSSKIYGKYILLKNYTSI